MDEDLIGARLAALLFHGRRPELSMENRQGACRRQRSGKGIMSKRESHPNRKRPKRSCLAPSFDDVVRSEQARPSLASHPRPLRDPAQRDHASTDQGGNGRSLLPSLSGNLSHDARLGGRHRTASLEVLGRLGLLPTRQKPARPGAKGDRSPRRKASVKPGRPTRASRPGRYTTAAVASLASACRSPWWTAT
jgi:hypothetical protein